MYVFIYLIYLQAIIHPTFSSSCLVFYNTCAREVPFVVSASCESLTLLVVFEKRSDERIAANPAGIPALTKHLCRDRVWQHRRGQDNRENRTIQRTGLYREEVSE